MCRETETNYQQLSDQRQKSEIPTHEMLVGNFDAYVKFEARANHRTRSQNAERSGNGIAFGRFREPGRSGTERGYIGEADSSGDALMGGINSTRILRGPNGGPLRAK